MMEQTIHTLLDDDVPRQFSGVNPSANYTFSANENILNKLVDNTSK